MLARLDDAAVLVGLDADVHRMLRSCEPVLEVSIPVRMEDTPSHGNYPGADGQVHYVEGLLVGYRWYDAKGIQPALRFVHGLS